MRIQARLFLGTALLVLALMGVQWWLHMRQLRDIETELAAVATSVGKGLLSGNPSLVANPGAATSGTQGPPPQVKVKLNGAQIKRRFKVKAPADGDSFDDEQNRKNSDGDEQHHLEVFMIGDGDPAMFHAAAANISADLKVIHEAVVAVPARVGANQVACETMTVPNLAVSKFADLAELAGLPQAGDGEPVLGSIDWNVEVDQSEGIRKIHLQVVREPDDRSLFLVASHPGQETRIPIPLDDTLETFRSTLRQGITASAALLVIGLVASGLLANRVARPLQQLADRAEAVGQGDLGVQVPVTASGEVGDLQRSFNRMSQRLGELEGEQEQWRQREHLAQLGDLSRGLAHTLRNPLNTLGLAVEELATDQNGEPQAGRQRLVVAARAQIRRIDHWLRSFLALGAGDAASEEESDLGQLVQAVALESIQQGGRIRLDMAADALPVHLVPTALKAALANLVENAVEASPPDAEVTINVRGEGSSAVVVITDRGPGLPEEVRERLYSPHVTTKVGGSGMGLFLARQLVVSMHHGSLSLADGEGCGTVATIQLPLASEADHES